MSLQQQVRRDAVTGADLFDGERHCVNIAEHLNSSDVRSIVTKLSGGFCPQQSASPDLQPLDPWRSDRLRPEQDTCKRLGIDKAARLDVPPGHGSLVISDGGSNLSRVRAGATM